MRNKVTSNFAIKRGSILLVKGKAIVLFISFFVSFFVFDYLASNQFIERNRFTLSLTWVFPLFFSYLYWGIGITKWKIWAYENVADLKEFKAKAIRNKVIPDDNSFSRKLEIKTKCQATRLKELELKFLANDVFENDPTVPNETILFYSKKHFLGGIVFSIFFFICGVFFVVIINSFIDFLFLFFISFYVFEFNYKKYKNHIPQMIINEKGVQMRNLIFMDWDVINDEVIFKQTNSLGISNLKIEYLIYVYRSRYKLNNSNES